MESEDSLIEPELIEACLWCFDFNDGECKPCRWNGHLSWRRRKPMGSAFVRRKNVEHKHSILPASVL